MEGMQMQTKVPVVIWGTALGAAVDGAADPDRGGRNREFLFGSAAAGKPPTRFTNRILRGDAVNRSEFVQTGVLVTVSLWEFAETRCPASMFEANKLLESIRVTHCPCLSH